MLRVVLGIVAGVAAGFGAVLATDAVVHLLAPGPAPAPGTPEMAAYAMRLPVAPLLAFAIGCGVASALGAGVAALIARRGPWPGWVVSGLLLLATIANFAMIAHPVWLVALSLALIVAAGWWSARVFGRRRV